MKTPALALALVTGLAAALPAAAQFQKPEDATKYRQSTMFVMANHFGRIGAMVNNRAPYDAAAATANAELVVTMSRLHPTGFVEGTAGTQKGQANAAIWTKRAEFDTGMKAMQDEVGKLLTASRANNLDTLKAAFGEAAKACKACHDKFRNQ
ncbi:MAG TPA: cytochrome c [Rubrivivax sp.]|jgi:cytochrome c556|nr:cytochrome c [Rubrivivax sp.]